MVPALAVQGHPRRQAAPADRPGPRAAAPRREPLGDEWPAVGEEAPRGPEPAGDAGIAAPEPVRPDGAGPPRVRLPADNPHFAGRAVSLGKLDLLVSQSQWPRAVVIQGMAGVGKTTLALHWAHRVVDRFPDGILFADLRGTERSPVTPGEAMGQVLRAAGVPGDRLPRTEAELAAQCRSMLADRRMLLILDNASRPEQVRPLLAAATSGLVVVTRAAAARAAGGRRHPDAGAAGDGDAGRRWTSSPTSSAPATPASARSARRSCGWRASAGTSRWRWA